MDKNSSKDANYTVIEGNRVYVGQERREDRRRLGHNERVERLLKNFGLDRRLRVERRRADSSWLLTSQKAANQ